MAHLFHHVRENRDFPGVWSWALVDVTTIQPWGEHLAKGCRCWSPWVPRMTLKESWAHSVV